MRSARSTVLISPTQTWCSKPGDKKVFIHLVRGETTEVLALFREIEPRIKKDGQFCKACLALAYSSPDVQSREEYSRKFLACRDLPASLQPSRAGVYANLAALARDARQPEKTKEYLERRGHGQRSLGSGGAAGRTKARAP